MKLLVSYTRSQPLHGIHLWQVLAVWYARQAHVERRVAHMMITFQAAGHCPLCSRSRLIRTVCTVICSHFALRSHRDLVVLFRAFIATESLSVPLSIFHRLSSTATLSLYCSAPRMHSFFLLQMTALTRCQCSSQITLRTHPSSSPLQSVVSVDARFVSQTTILLNVSFFWKLCCGVSSHSCQVVTAVIAQLCVSWRQPVDIDC
jgi:hypothetical protein